jgi:hypothetical protein
VLALLLTLALQTDGAAVLLDDATARIQKGGLQRAALVAAWADKARAYALLGDPDKAVRAFSVVLRVEPAYPLAADAEPVVRDAFVGAHDALPPAGEALAIRVDAAAGGVALTLLADDLDLVKGARLDDGPVVPLSAAASKVLLAGPGTAVHVVDKYGNVVADAPVPSTAVPGSAAAPPSWVSIAGAATIGVGIAGVVAAGLTYTTVGLTADDVQKGMLLAGTGVATGAVLVGAALVVGDLVLSGR